MFDPFIQRCLLFIALMLCGIGTIPTVANAQQQEEELKKDYSKELPRIPATTPANALKTFRARRGFRIELVASEPLIRDPIALDFDESGRMFVVEMPEYNAYGAADKKQLEHGCVRLLVDTDNDGRFDKSTIYVDKLSSPTSVACYGGGIYVGVVPDIIYCKDTDGDGRADIRKRVFTGFSRDRAGEAMLNSFRWGLDNRFHVSTSLAGGEVRRVDDSQSKPVSVRGRGFLFDPKTHQFELTSGGGQHGMSLDNWGRKFVCSNSNPSQLLIYDDRYLARNPYTAGPAAAINIAPGGKYTRIFRASAVEPWRKLRTRLRSKGLVPGPRESGKPAGFFTGATGITIYRGDAYPKEFRGNLFVGEVVSNLIYRAILKPNGVSLTAQRAEREVEFLTSTDNWFRPVQLANAPDGTLYAIDMYRELIEGAAFLPPQILQHLDVRSGRDRGRIYRIVPEDFQHPRMRDLRELTTSELVALLENPNGWHRDTASRLLYERQDRTAIDGLRKLASSSRRPEGRRHALSGLRGLKSLDEDFLADRFDDADPLVRQEVLRLSEPFAKDSAQLQARMIEAAKDSDLNVRYQAAFSLGAFTGQLRDQALVRLILKDGSNRWIQLAVLSSLNRGAGRVFEMAVGDRDFRDTKHGRSFLLDLAKQIAAANRQHEIGTVIKVSAGKLANEDRDFSQAIMRALLSKLRPDVLKLLRESGNEKIVRDMEANARTVVNDSQSSVEQRVEAIRTLGLASFESSQALFSSLLDLRQPPKVQAATLETLARYKEDAVAEMLIQSWPTLSPKLRATATETLLSRTHWLNRFLDSFEKGQIARADIDPARIRVLQAHPDKNIRSRVLKLFREVSVGERDKIVAQYQKALELKGVLKRGQAHFKKNCSACHRLENVGNTVGPDLAAIRNRGLAAVLLNILNPNREVKPQYLNYVVETNDGRIVTGMITTETANSIKFVRADGTSVDISRVDIDQLRSTGLSFMPEGLELKIDQQAMADLLAYLNSIK